MPNDTRTPRQAQKLHRNLRLQAEHNAWLNAYKLERGCADCGYREAPEALDLDHVRGVKLFLLSKAHTRRRAAVMEELEKCEVVCANCHRIRTKARLNA